MTVHNAARSPESRPGGGAGRLPGPVWLLGWTSFFTDTANEAIYPLLPVFLTRVLGSTAVSLGVIEGVAEAANSVLKIAAGWLSDRWRVRRPIVIAGYSLSSAVRPLIGFATAWPEVLIVRTLDRAGKGVRGAPRDALLAVYATPETRGLVYGFHRAMDHAGAVAGPLLATGFLLAFPDQYRTLFLLTIIPGAIAVALLFRVPERTAGKSVGESPAVVGQDFSLAVRFPRQLYVLLGIILLFSLGNSSDAFLLLRLSDAGVSTPLLPFMWAMLHVVKAGLSTYGGQLSDRWSRRGVIAIGWLVYAVVYAGFAATSSTSGLIAWFLAYGLYFALAEGAERALVADMAPEATRGSAFGLYNGALGIGHLLASVVFGLVWKAYGASAAFGLGAGLALVATVLLVIAGPRRRA